MTNRCEGKEFSAFNGQQSSDKFAKHQKKGTFCLNVKSISASASRREEAIS
ncbi:MAG: hypothetical protein WAU62_01505 [Dehalococcoidales bacterium]|jgi:hypothetical protein